MTVSEDQERRRYFRVTDLVGMRYRFLSEAEVDLALAAQPTNLKNIMSQIEDQIGVILQTLKPQHPDLHQLLDLYNQKINLAFGHGLGDKNSDMGSSMRACEVNLSACGIAFATKESPTLNQYVELDITLYPSNTRVQLMAAVIGVEACSGGESEQKNLVRADFVNISDTDQEILVQHVIKRQAIQLKELREQG